MFIELFINTAFIIKQMSYLIISYQTQYHNYEGSSFRARRRLGSESDRRCVSCGTVQCCRQAGGGGSWHSRPRPPPHHTELSVGAKLRVTATRGTCLSNAAFAPSFNKHININRSKL